MNNNDALFAVRTVETTGLTIRGLWPAARSESDVFVKREDSDRESLVLPLRHGNA